MGPILRFEVIKAREALRAAESALGQVEELAETDFGLAINLTVQQRRRHAVRRVDAARAALRRLQPTAKGRR